jgi:hypothetical protein
MWDSGGCRSGCTGEYVPLLATQRLDPIDYRAHPGGATQITMDDDPVFGGDFGIGGVSRSSSG